MNGDELLICDGVLDGVEPWNGGDVSFCDGVLGDGGVSFFCGVQVYDDELSCVELCDDA